MSVRSKQLREERAKLVTEAQALLRNQTLTPEIRMKFDAMMARQDEMAVEIRNEEEAEQRAAAVTDGARVVDAYGARFETKSQREYRMVWNKYLRSGIEFMEPEERRRLLAGEKRDYDASSQLAGQQVLAYTELTAGGAFVPAGFQHEIDQALKYYCPFLDGGVCRVLNTDSGQLLPFPTGNDVSNVATPIAESTSVGETPVTVGVVNFGAYKYTSNVIRVSIELLQDSAFDFDGYLIQRFAERFGRGYEAAFTTGTGSGQPTGLITALIADGGSTVITRGSSTNDGVGAASNSIGTNDLVELEHAVDPSYRRNGRFMLHDKTLKLVKQLLDKYGRPLWLPGISVNAPDTILGYPYSINQSMPQVSAGIGAVMVFGDFSHFVVRQVKPMSVLRLVERYAEYGQQGFLAFGRVDSNLVDAGTHPLAALNMHS